MKCVHILNSVGKSCFQSGWGASLFRVCTGAFALCGLLSLSPSVRGDQPAEQLRLPNIIFILADDLGYGDISSLNPEGKIKTPHIDKLANQGAAFTDAHSSSSVCTPTRYSILTGRYNWRSALKSGVLNGYSKPLIEKGRTTLGDMLKRKNYHAACIGKWHLGWNWGGEGKPGKVDFSESIKGGPTASGFDYFYGFSGSLDMPPYVYVENDRPTSAKTEPVKAGQGFGFYRAGLKADDFDIEDCLPNLTRRVERFITEQSKKKDPFFLYFPLPAPHTPILPAKEYQGKSGLNPYGDFVMMVDDVVGKVIDCVEKNGIAKDTIIVFTSDNGCSPKADFPALAAKGHHPSYIYRGHKADLFDGGHRIPCMIYWPGRITPKLVNQTVCLTDFMATFASLVGEKLADNEGEDSYDVSPLIFGEGSDKPIREATVHHSINGSFTIRKGDWKLLFGAGSGGWSYPRPEEVRKIKPPLPDIQLYNMKDDPGEKTNVYDKHSDIVKDLTALMASYIVDGRSTPGTPQKNTGGLTEKENHIVKMSKDLKN